MSGFPVPSDTVAALSCGIPVVLDNMMVQDSTVETQLIR